MPTDGHSGFLKTGGSHIGAGRLFWYWGKAQRRVRAAQVQTNSKRAARQCEPRRLFAPRKALCFFRKKACPWVFSPTRPEGDWGRAESPQCARRRKPLPRRGLTRRLRRGLGLAVPWGALLLRLAIRRGCRGERREARAQWAQPPKAVSDPEFRQTTSGAHGSAGRADCLPRGKPPCLHHR